MDQNGQHDQGKQRNVLMQGELRKKSRDYYSVQRSCYVAEKLLCCRDERGEMLEAKAVVSCDSQDDPAMGSCVSHDRPVVSQKVSQDTPATPSLLRDLEKVTHSEFSTKAALKEDVIELFKYQIKLTWGPPPTHVSKQTGTNIKEIELMTYEDEEKEAYHKLNWDLPENCQTLVERTRGSSRFSKAIVVAGQKHPYWAHIYLAQTTTFTNWASCCPLHFRENTLRYICYNGQNKGSRSCESDLTPKTRPQFGLQAATRLHDVEIASTHRSSIRR
ncbi:hypothetical protein RND71_005542 [Anisodus tanguticus]|uniref:Uncharacterized protein n=1 Tax=Anisodus tanguticus TaxID=243964 RepID=A0AAE1SRP5_9SOLA|nr:hypothetical protein RND71_005542 [Anisodus tanguticus]